MAKAKETAASLAEYQSEDVDERGRKITKVDFGDQSEMPRVMFRYNKGSIKEDVPMKKVVAETLELRGVGKIVKGTAPERPTIESATAEAARIRKEKEEATR